MSDWGVVFRFLVGFGGACLILVGAMLLFAVALYIISKKMDE